MGGRVPGLHLLSPAVPGSAHQRVTGKEVVPGHKARCSAMRWGIPRDALALHLTNTWSGYGGVRQVWKRQAGEMGRHPTWYDPNSVDSQL